MKTIHMNFEDIMNDQVLMEDEKIQNLVEMIIANRQVEEMYDAQMEKELVDSLSDAISQKIADKILQDHGAEISDSLSDMSMDEVLEHIQENSQWDVPAKELPEMINHFAPSDNDRNIFDRFDALDTDVKERTMDKLANIEGLDEYDYEDSYERRIA